MKNKEIPHSLNNSKIPHGTILKYHTVWTVLKYHTLWTILKYHTVWTILKYHTVWTILKYHTVWTILKYHTVWTILKFNRKIVKWGNCIKWTLFFKNKNNVYTKLSDLLTCTISKIHFLTKKITQFLFYGVEDIVFSSLG